jgi:hypothetical protein
MSSVAASAIMNVELQLICKVPPEAAVAWREYGPAHREIR